MRKIVWPILIGLGALTVLGLMFNTASSAPLLAPPLNDDFNSAVVIGTTPYTDTQDTTQATTVVDDPACVNCGTGNGVNSHSVWYRFTAPGDGSMQLDTSGSNYDTVLAVWRGTRGALTQVACDDDGGANLTSVANFNVTGGTIYYVEVTSYAATVGGNLQLHVTYAATKLLYLHRTATSVTTVNGLATNQIMDRRVPTATTTTNVSFNNAATYFYLYPGLTGGLSLQGAITVSVYLDGAPNGSSNVTMNLVDLAPGGATVTIGTRTWAVARRAHAWYYFALTGINQSVAIGHALRLSFATSAANRTVQLEYDSTTRTSQVALPATTFVNVDQVATVNNICPSGAGVFGPGQPVTITARVSDPFGSYDVKASSLRLTDSVGAVAVPGLAMTPILTSSGAVTYTYSYLVPVTATLGTWAGVVTGTEANNVQDTGVVTFAVQRPISLTAVLTANPTPVNVNDRITATLIVTNAGSLTVTTLSPSALTPSGTGSAIVASGPSPTSTASLSPGKSVTFTWTLTATSPGLLNWIVSASANDLSTCALVSTGAVTTTRPVSITAPVLALSKSVVAPVGSPVFTYTVQFTNTGNGAAYPVRITDTLPAGVIWGGVLSSSLPLTVISTTPRVWTTPILTAGLSGNIIFTVTIPVTIPVGTDLVNQVSMSSGQSPVVTASVHAAIGTLVVMSIDKTDGPDPVIVGNTLVYMLSYANSGGSTASTVVITETYPNVLYQSANPPPSVGNNIWNISSLPANTSGTIVITVTAPMTAGTVTNLVTLGSLQTLPITDSTATTVILPPPSFVLTKSGKPGPVLVGSSITYTLSYRNTGGTTATNVVMTETYDPNMTLVSAVPAPNIGNNVWNFGNVSAGAAGTIVVTVTVDAAGTLTNQATMDSLQTLPITAFATTTVVPPPPAFVLTKSGDLDPVLIGTDLTYEIDYQNVGGDAHGVVITEAYDPNATFVSAIPAPDSGNNVWNINALNAGASGAIFVTVQVNGGTALVNNVTMTSAEGVSATATAINSTVVTGQVAIDKSVTPSTFPGASKLVTYTILITNSGATAVPVDQITDTIPAGFTYSTTVTTTNIAMPDVIDDSGQPIIWSYNDPVPSIPPHTTAKLTFVATSGATSACNSAGVTIEGSIGVVAEDNLACLGWPEYLIAAQAGSQTIRVRVRLVNGLPTILAWEFLP